MANPTVSVICFTHNRPHLLPKFIQRLRDQTFTDWELIIVDESDNYYSEKYAESGKIRTFPFPHPHDWGYSSKEFAALELASGEWLMFPNDDHIYQPNFLERMLDHAEASDSDLVMCDFLHWAISGMVYTAPLVGRVDVGTFIIKRSLFNRYGFFDKGGLGDGELVMRIANENERVHTLHETLVALPE